LAFNNQHRQGYGLDGSTNLDLFSGIPATQNFTGSAGSTITVGWAVPLNVAAMQPESYEVRFDGANYTIARTHDGQTLYSGAALPATFQGLTLAGTLAANERVILRPFQARGGVVSWG